MLLRTILLPLPIVQMIALLLPLPPFWRERISVLEFSTSIDCPNEAIVCALDIIDEILEFIGFLSAFDTAKIPAPNPHKTWVDWNRSAQSKPTRKHQVDTTVSDNRPFPLTISRLQPPLPRDENNPTLWELRRMTGYLPLLSQYQSRTDIVHVLTQQPYHIDRELIDQLIGIADVASICRRCCVQPMMPVASHNEFRQCIEFDTNIALDIISLAEDLYHFYHATYESLDEDSDDDPMQSAS
jgi:hypothetical protein